jgi:hypothetical protein
MRSVYIFCAAFVVFYLVGAFTERQARKKITDHDFLLDTAASRFDRLPFTERSTVKGAFHKLYYRCGNQILYSFDTNTSVVQAEVFRTLKPPFVEASFSHEEIALLAAGWGVSEGAAYLRLTLGMSWKDKIAALLGGLSGYTLGRLTFSRTRPACEGDETARLLNQISGKEVSHAIVKLNLNRFLILLDRSTVVELPSQITSLKQSYEMREGHPIRTTDSDCMPEQLYSPRIRCYDFLTVERLESKVADSASNYSAQDIEDSFYYPVSVASWIEYRRADAAKGFSPHVLRGVTTKPDLIRLGDNVLLQQGKDLLNDKVLRYTVYILGIPIACLILIAGIAEWLRVFRSIAIRFSRDLKAPTPIISSSEQRPNSGP